MVECAGRLTPFISIRLPEATGLLLSWLESYSMNRILIKFAVCGALALTSGIGLVAEPITVKKEPDPKLLEATEEQLAAAKEEFAKHGARYIASMDPAMKELFLTTHVFSMRFATDADLKGLPDLPFYFALSINGSNVTDKGLKELKNLKHLTLLEANETNVGDEGMKELKVLENLRRLSLQHTKVTDAGLKELKELKNLKELILGNTKNVQPMFGLIETPVTDAGVAELKRSLPRCIIGR